MRSESIVILANGDFPQSDIPLAYLKNADRIICCDGAVEKLVSIACEPDAIVGDMDSIPGELKSRFASILYPDMDEDCNDLTKAVRFCLGKGYDDLVIVGATGKREDHTLGNISLLAEYSETLSAKIVSDSGIFIPVNSGVKISAYPGQQVSIFSFTENFEISSKNLKYPLERLILHKLWMGTLNECTSDYFSLYFAGENVIVFLAF